MARMIPPTYSKKTPKGERSLFHKLEGDPDTKGWVVFHSLDIKKHLSKIEGELDMVVLVPHQGILCIEVKGCDVKRIEGEWIYSYEKKSPEGPFKQASTAMHSLRNYLTSKDTSLRNLLYFSCAVFTNVNFDEESSEWHKWQYINARIFREHPISKSILNILSRAHKHTLGKVGSSSWYSTEKSRPTDGQINKTVSLLRNDFVYPIQPRTLYEEAEQMVLSYTEEQYEALDLLLDNDRVLFKGPAGTGKTFIAIEQARRASAENKKVLFLCYNRLLGNWLKETTKVINSEGINCNTFHGLLLEIVNEKPSINAGNDYWNDYLPNKAIECLLDDKCDFQKFDFIVLDEAQDLIRNEFVDILDILLMGGLAGGKWAFFGDFERQAIYIQGLKEGADKALVNLELRSPRHVNYPLRINCRNSEVIAQTLTITSGLKPGYKRILNKVEGSDVSPYFYGSKTDQEKILSEYIIDAKKVYNSRELVILSMNDDSKSCAGNLTSNHLNLQPIKSSTRHTGIAYGSIHAFKGLEAAVVVVTDIETLNDARTQSLLYIGMSRARIKLCMLMHEKCRSEYTKLLDQGFASSARG